MCLKIPVPDSPPLCRAGKPTLDKEPRRTRACPATAARPYGPLADGPEGSVGQGNTSTFPLSSFPSLVRPSPSGPPGPHDPRLRVTSAALPATTAGATAQARPARRLCRTYHACAARCLMGLVVPRHCQRPALSPSLERPERWREARPYSISLSFGIFERL